MSTQVDIRSDKDPDFNPGAEPGDLGRRSSARRGIITVTITPDPRTEAKLPETGPPPEQPGEGPRMAILRGIEARSRFMNPKPSERDFLREGWDGGMFGDKSNEATR